MKNQSSQAENAKERLLETAERLFAEKGYNDVSIRDITQTAECNVAAVNYYFGNKENLYYDVFRKRIIPKMADLHDQIEAHIANHEPVTLEIVIRAFVTISIKNNILNNNDDVFQRLINSERYRPTKAKNIIVNEALVPFYENLMDLFRPHFPEGMSESKIKLNILSILGMVLYFSHSQLSVTRFIQTEYKVAFINELIEHTVAFALHGLNGI